MERVIPRRRFIFLYIVAVTVGVLGGMIVFSRPHHHFDFLTVASFLVNILLFYQKYIQSVSEYAFSIDMMYWLFALFFFGIAPLLQFLTGIYAWNLRPSDAEVLRTNLYVFLWSLFYIAGQRVRFLPDVRIRPGVRMFRTMPKKKQPEKWPADEINGRRKYVLLLGAAVITGYFMYQIGFRNMFSRSAATVQGLSQTMGLIVSHGFRNFVLFVTAFFVIDAKRKGKISVGLMLALVCMLLSCFPLSISRNMMASFYAGLMILTVDKTREGRWFALVILGGLVLVFPAVEIFRRAGNVTSLRDIGPLMLESMQATYLQGHYDAHQMFISIQRYVEQVGFSWGYHLLGCIFFFVPRSIWPDKPYGTGRTAFEWLKQHSFTNVSAPLVAEAYVNFGVIGIVVFAALLGKLVKILDRKYWSEPDELSWIRVLYPFAIFMLFFMQRGDLMSSGSYTCAQVAVGTVLHWFVVRKYPAETAESGKKDR